MEPTIAVLEPCWCGVKRGGEEVFCNPMVRSQSFSGSVALACDFTRSSLAFFPALSETGRLAGAGAERFPFPQLGSCCSKVFSC